MDSNDGDDNKSRHRRLPFYRAIDVPPPLTFCGHQWHFLFVLKKL